MRCAVGCGHLQRGADEGLGVADVRGHVEHPVNRGLACRRGIRESVDPEGEWLSQPLVRRGDSLEPTDWNTALGIVASECIEALADDPDRVAVLGSGQQTNEAAYALGKVARGAIGTRHYDANTTLCMASAVTAYYQAFGSDAPPPTYDDVPETTTHLVWGANPAVAHPVLYRWILDSATEAGCELLVVDPVESETAGDADCHVAIEPGTDLALARAVLARVVDRGMVDHAFVEQSTTGFAELVGSLPAATDAAATAGISLETVDRIADALAEPTLLYWGMGVNQSVQGTTTARALIDLCLATGNLRPGSGPFSLTGQANSMGARVCASKGTWPGHRAFGDPGHRKTVATTWDVPLGRLPEDPGPGPVGIVDNVLLGDVDVCWTVATNPVAGMPDAGTVRRAVDDVFLVAQDAFWTETVARADVVLPAATWGETNGTTTNMERTVSRVTPATVPPADIRQDIDIIAEIGNRIEPELFSEPPIDPEGIFDELRELTAGTPADLSGITYDRLERELAVRWPTSDPTSQGGYRYYVADESSWSFPTADGRARFSRGNYSGLAEPPTEAYPLTLTTGRRADTYNTGVRMRETGGDGLPVARLHPEEIVEYIDALDRGRTVIQSRRASITVEVQPDDRAPPGVVWMDIHHPDVNELTLPAVDPESNEPNYKQCAVAVVAPEQTPPLNYAGLSHQGTADVRSRD
ncbi:nitrate reductase [Salinadaptatus halalkaliphilus]|uniref:Nitrate reductase n=2 Tax=Salinadaptatus halalkaliphilus TaxID=2419781 RepID=A0A4S3TNI1_9EURY|nr:nitrate reductase [Salinadaptatus halalkaliphilus]